MIASLRGRLVAGVLALAAVGMLLVGGDHLRDAARLPARPRRRRSSRRDRCERELDGPRARPPRGRGGGPPPGGGAPTDTYVERRDASGEVLDGEFLGPDDSGARARPAAPSCRASEPRRPSGGYRVLAEPTAADGTTTVAAIPMDATNEALARLLARRGAS